MVRVAVLAGMKILKITCERRRIYACGPPVRRSKGCVYYTTASPVDVTRRVVTCRPNASVPDVHTRLGNCACANIHELATAGSRPKEHLA